MFLGFSILDGLWLLIGFIYSAFLGSFAIANILHQYYTGYHEATTRERWRVAILGIVERCLYSSSWIAGVPEFVAIWLALKVAGQWDRWRADWQAGAGKNADDERKRDAARATYTGYLLGNALSIAYGVVGALIAQWLQADQVGKAIVLPAALLLASLALYGYLRHKAKAALSALATKDARPAQQ